MPKRSYSAAGSYRYGFNGKENDNDVKGLGNQQDYGMRIYDARVGRFYSYDPVSSSFPSLTPYQFASNSPIAAEDFDGLQGNDRVTVAPSRPRPLSRSMSVDKKGRLVTPPGETAIGPPPVDAPPNGEIHKAPGGWVVSGPNGSTFIADQNPFGKQRPRPTTTEELMSRDAQYALYNFKKSILAEKETQLNDKFEIFTNPENLPDWYIQVLKERYLSGKASVNDLKYRDELIKRGALASRFGEGQVLGKGADSKILGENLERAGHVRPPISHAAHHIVAGTDKRAALARLLLAKNHIDINDAVNGVFLESTQHYRTHTDDYYRKIERRLLSAPPGKMREELTKIGEEIKKGTF